MSSKRSYPLPGQLAVGPHLDPIVSGTLWGLTAAVGYTAANICLRSVAGCDPAWVSCIKSVPTVVLVGPWLVVRRVRKLPVLPPPWALAALALAGLLGQLGGNVVFQWSLGEIGIALAVPLTLGAMILSSAVLGRIVLHEPVTVRTAVSIVVLAAAITVLSQGAGAAQQSIEPQAVAAQATEAQSSAAWFRWAAVAAASAAGVAYAVLGVVIRRGVTRHTSLSTTLFTVALVGMLSLGTLSTLRIGVGGMLDTSWHDFQRMLGAGLCNTLAFLSLTKALQLTRVVYVNGLNATQAAMAAVAGVILFQEAVSMALVLGVVLTIVGLVLMKAGRDVPAPETPEDSPTGDELATAVAANPDARSEPSGPLVQPACESD